MEINNEMMETRSKLFAEILANQGDAEEELSYYILDAWKQNKETMEADFNILKSLGKLEE